MLIELCEHEDEDVRGFSAEGILELFKEFGLEILKPFLSDRIIGKIINEYKADRNVNDDHVG